MVCRATMRCRNLDIDELRAQTVTIGPLDASQSRVARLYPLGSGRAQLGAVIRDAERPIV